MLIISFVIPLNALVLAYVDERWTFQFLIENDKQTVKINYHGIQTCFLIFAEHGMFDEWDSNWLIFHFFKSQVKMTLIFFKSRIRYETVKISITFILYSLFFFTKIMLLRALKQTTFCLSAVFSPFRNKFMNYLWYLCVWIACTKTNWNFPEVLITKFPWKWIDKRKKYQFFLVLHSLFSLS